MEAHSARAADRTNGARNEADEPAGAVQLPHLRRTAELLCHTVSASVRAPANSYVISHSI